MKTILLFLIPILGYCQTSLRGSVTAKMSLNHPMINQEQPPVTEIQQGAINELEIPEKSKVRVALQGRDGLLQFVEVIKVVTAVRWEPMYYNSAVSNTQGNCNVCSTSLSHSDIYHWAIYQYHYEDKQGRVIKSVYSLVADNGKP
jgi:hypothetical protein